MGNKIPEIDEKVVTRTELTEPPNFKVLLLNDNYTTMDFVVEILGQVFNKTPSEAVQIMLNVHKKGVGLCGIYTQEVAETKVAMVQHLAVRSNFPLKCIMEEL
jgi:ATP-dependent Clp protease adaptor protein ClpS